MLRALNLVEEKYGKDNIEIVTILNNLALLWEEMQKYSESISLMKRLINIKEKHLGKNYSGYIHDLTLLIRIIKNTTMIDEVKLIFQDVCKIDESNFIPENKNLIRNLYTLGEYFIKEGMTEEAEEAYKKAINIDEEFCYGDMSELAIRYFELATMYYQKNRLLEAEVYLRKVVEIYDKQTNINHKEYKIILINLADLLIDLNKIDEAEGIFSKIVELDEKVLGINHIDVANSLGDLIKIYRSKKRYVEVERLSLRAIRIYINYFKLIQLLSEGFESAGTRHHLARICLITDRLPEAEKQITEAWNVKHDAKPYITARLIWFKIALSFLESKPLGNYLGQLKFILQKEDAFMEWTMQPVLDHIKPQITIKQHALLSALVAAMSNKINLEKLNVIEEWRNAKPEEID
ncbi:MAG: tetratricopeptide repeat protein [Bacteroidales bacterium]|nr:tetratricopeptide repeat protein [Bacteroidales bacterium]